MLLRRLRCFHLLRRAFLLAARLPCLYSDLRTSPAQQLKTLFAIFAALALLLDGAQATPTVDGPTAAANGPSDNSMMASEMYYHRSLQDESGSSDGSAADGLTTESDEEDKASGATTAVVGLGALALSVATF